MQRRRLERKGRRLQKLIKDLQNEAWALRGMTKEKDKRLKQLNKRRAKDN